MRVRFSRSEAGDEFYEVIKLASVTHHLRSLMSIVKLEARTNLIPRDTRDMIERPIVESVRYLSYDGVCTFFFFQKDYPA